MFLSITQELAKNGVINREDIEVCVFGLRQGALFLLNIATTILVGILLGMLPESVVFILAFVPLRSFAGGYHAKTQTRCYILGIISTTVALLLLKYLVLDVTAFIALEIVSGSIIFFFAPVPDSNKPLDEIEVTVYRKNSLSILVLENLIMVLLYVTGVRRLSCSILFALALLSIAIMAGRILPGITEKPSEQLS